MVSVTDHDTLAGLAEARDAAARHGIRLVNGVEITAVEDCRDVHMLGYFIDPADTGLAAFLDRQRVDRVRRVRDIADRLRSLGYPDRRRRGAGLGVRARRPEHRPSADRRRARVRRARTRSE